MDYINYYYETLYDIYNQWYFDYYVSSYKINDNKINIDYTNEVEISKLIKEVENEIRIDKEIKELEDRYINLFKTIKEEDDNDRDNNNKSNNDGAIKIKIKN